MTNPKFKLWAYFNADNTLLLASPIRLMAKSWLDMLRGISAFGVGPEDELELVEGFEGNPRVEECFRYFREMGGARISTDYPVVFNDGTKSCLRVYTNDGEPFQPVREGDKLILKLRDFDMLFCGHDFFGDCIVEVDLNAKTIRGLGVKDLSGEVSEFVVSL